MITLHDVAAIRAAEHAHSDELNSGVLMDRAAHGVSAAVIDLLQQVFGRVVGSRVVLLVGPGNNGGDALFAGAKLLRRGVRASAITSSSRFHPGGAEAFTSAGGLLMPWSAEALADLQAADLIIDGLLGIGAVGDLRAPMDEIVAATRSARGLIVSVDVPTGVDADTGAIANEVVDADQTVTFGGVKPGLLVNPG
ncbi:MAG: NAD(P)H-hydrate epimerase, partial [Actinobacteria bacterium]|nr:NAD(P)H-hydrate epimerase [Actinomycetota bacterium]